MTARTLPSSPQPTPSRTRWGWNDERLIEQAQDNNAAVFCCGTAARRDEALGQFMERHGHLVVERPYKNVLHMDAFGKGLIVFSCPDDITNPLRPTESPDI